MNDHAHLLELFLDHLKKHTTSLSDKHPVELYAPEKYILSLGGKRIRPLLALVACDLFDADPKQALGSALCVELFHNFSLVHDDILDGAPLRRNKPTVHTKWNVNIAILSGDAMLVKAFQALEPYSGVERQALFALFSKTAIDVCEGQQFDMNFETQKDVAVSDYLHMILLKTAVLLGCSLKMGAINAGSSEGDQNYLYDFGKHLGIAFQLMDDYLDAFAEDSEKFGKQLGGDIISNKKTFLLLKAMELANTEQRGQLNKILNCSDPKEKVSDMLKIYDLLHIKQYCMEEADKHTALAIQALEHVSGSPPKKLALKTFALDLLNRQI
ncbi:MAG: polyprenyl synthetase family protein [bacterium]|nr:polyprenyl synthetase family protein [bacterium]